MQQLLSKCTSVQSASDAHVTSGGSGNEVGVADAEMAKATVAVAETVAVAGAAAASAAVSAAEAEAGGRDTAVSGTGSVDFGQPHKTKRIRARMGSEA